MPDALIRRCLQLLFALGVMGGLASCGPAPWQVQTLDPLSRRSGSLDAAALQDRYLLINYWAEWCKPCIAEIPELSRFAAQQAQRVQVVGYNFDGQQGDELLATMARVKMDFPALSTNPASVFALPEISGLPTTVILDSEGRLVSVLMGPQTLATLEQALPSR